MVVLSYAKEDSMACDIPAAALALVACQAALVNSPAASRAANTKHRTSIDQAFAITLDIVGGYKYKVKQTVPLDAYGFVIQSFCYNISIHSRMFTSSS